MSHYRKRLVAIIDSDDLVRKSLVHVVNMSEDFVVVGSYRDLEEALRHLSRISPEIVLLDILAPGTKEVEGIRKFKGLYPSTDVIVISASEDPELVMSALRAGAGGYLVKNNNYLQIVAALQELRAGGAPISSRIAKVVVESLHINRDSPLTKREQEVLVLFSKGKTYSEISDELLIARETAKTHLRHIYKKLQVRRKSHALERAYEKRLI